MIKYITPPDLRFASTEEKSKLRVRYHQEIGFEIEIREDLANGSWRQIFTGAQAQFNWTEIYNEDLEFSVKQATLKINPETGALNIVEAGIEFETGIAAFASHDQAIELYNEINSLELTDLAGNTPAAFPPTTYVSHMRRFQYRRPTGPILGLPGQNGELNRNGYRFELYNTDQFVHTPARTPMYQSWPIVMHQVSGGWCAIFFDNPSRTFVDLGEFQKDRVIFEATSNNLRVYILLAPSLEQVSQKLVKLLGRPICPPRWAFGYQQSRWSYMDAEKVRAVVADFKSNGIPLHAIYFDIDYMQDFKVFTVNQERFPNLAGLNKELLDQGIKPLCIIDPGVKIEAKYEVYQDILKSDAYLKTATGEPFIAEVWPGDTLLPDFANSAAAKIWKAATIKWLKDYNFVGLWNDMNEPSNFRGQNKSNQHALTERGNLELDHNLYGYHMAKVSAEAAATVNGADTLIISRAGYPGLQQFAIAWHGDNQCWWEHLRLALRTCLQYSLCGLFFTGADVPGFTGNAPDDLAVRYFQLGAFLPFYRGHSWKYSNSKEPYAFGKEANQAIKAAILLRESMLDLWHQEYEKASQNFCSPILPSFDNEANLVDDQFLLFNRFLIAPVVERDASRRLVYLPEGSWKRFNFGEKEKLSGGDWIVEKVNLTTIPVYERIK